MRLALLGGVSIIAFGIVLGRAPAACAQQVISASTASTVNSNGTGIFVNPDVDLTGSPGISNNTVTGTIYSEGTIESGSFGLENFSTIGTLTNAGGGTIAGPSNGIYNTSGSIGTLSNNGLIFGNGANARGVQNQGGTISLLTNSGTITGSSGIAAQTGIGTIINQNGGTISSTGADYGIYVNAAVDLLENQLGGTISSGAGTAVLVQSHSIATLANSGLITGANGVGNLNGTIGTLQNAGTIAGTSEGVYNYAELDTLTNTGTISGVSYGMGNSGSIGSLTNNRIITGASDGFSNDGTVTALLNETTGTLTGSISGSIGVLNTAGGTIGAFVNGLPGASSTADTVFGSNTGVSNQAFIDTLSNNGTIHGGVIGIDNSYSATLQTFVIRAALPQGDTQATIATLTNTGSITGGSTAVYNNSGFIGTLGNSGTIAGTTIAGVDNTGTIGTLANTIAGTIHGGRFGIFNGGSVPRVTGAGSGGSIILNAPDVLTNSGRVITNVTVTKAVPSATISVLSNSGSISGGSTAVYNDAGYIGTLINSGSITGGSYGVFNTGTIGTVANTGGYISYLDNTSIIGTGATGIGNRGLIATLANTGTISGATFGINNTIAGTIGTLTNSGTINAAGGNGNRLDAISDAGLIGTLTNAQGATIIGANTGITYYGSIGTLNNSGLISGTNYQGIDAEGTMGELDNTATGTISANVEAIGAGTIGTVINAGTITGAFGIYVFGSIGTLDNSGGIYSTRFYTGVDVESGTISALTNTGTISGADYGVSDGRLIGTLTNSGTITGTTAGFINYTSITALLNETTGTLAGSISGSIGVFSTDSGNTAGTIGLLMNGLPGASITADTVFGSITGVSNQADIGTLANNGTIYGGEYGIANSYHVQVIDSVIPAALPQGDTQATIATLTNTGSITGVDTGIYNDAGYIGTLTNSGTISGNYAIFQETGAGGGATIATLTNSGVISGNTIGIFNGVANTIGTLTNSGTISGGISAIDNGYGATIGLLTNSGTISGPDSIYNRTFIGTLGNSGTIAGNSLAINNDFGTINLLTNSGLIQNSIPVNEAIYNDGGTIFTLSQSGGGTISGGTIGVLNYNGATITQFTNGLAGNITTDKIFGGITGVSNYGGTIGNLSNNGTIAGGTYGISNSLYEYSLQEEVVRAALTANQTQATIATLTNTGSIAGGSTGIYNTGGYIGTLTNSATIIGGSFAGIDNDPSGTIDTLSNTALITGGTSGVHNNGTIGTLINSGTISGGAFGIDGAGTIGQISNGGTIAGIDGTGAYMDFGTFTNQTGGVISGATDGVQFASSGSTLVNAGTIISTQDDDAIQFSSFGSDFLTLTTGSLIDGTIYGNDGPDNQIILEGTGNLDNAITNFGTGSALDVVSGADWTASGTWAIGAVTNDGSFGPGETANGGVGSTLFLTGNFTQNADGTLLVAVAPEEGAFTTSDFVITGNATLSGAADFTFAPGTYESGSHSFLSATNVTGTFTSEHYTNTPSGLTAGVLYPDETDPVLTLSGGTGIVNTGTTTTSTITTPPVITPPVVPPTFVVRPADTSIYPDELQSSASRAQASNAALLGKAAEGAAAAAAVCGAEAGITPAQTTPDKITGVEKLTNAVADAFCGAGGWIQASGTAMNVEGEGATPGYNADTAGFLAGIDAPVNNAGTRLGLAVGYDETFLANSAGSKGQVDTLRAGIFGSQAAGPFMLAGDFLYGHTSTNTQRVTGIGYAKSSADGNIYSGALQADTLVHLGMVNLVPQAGLRIAGVSGNSFAESGVLPAFALTGNSGFYTSVQPFVNVDVSSVFLTQSNVAITPDAAFGYAYEAGDIGHALIVTSQDGTHFATDYLKLDPNIASLSAGLSASAGKWSFYARYSAQLTGNWTSQTGEAGLRLRF